MLRRSPNPVDFVRRSSTLRSAITNDPLKLRGAYAKTAEGRRFLNLMRAYSAPLGGALEAMDAALVREAVSKTLESEAIAATLARGESVDSEQSTRIGNTLSRLLRQLASWVALRYFACSSQPSGGRVATRGSPLWTPGMNRSR